MSARGWVTGALIAPWLLPALAAADHAAAPMMAPARAPMSEARFNELAEVQGRSLPAETIITRFKVRHAQSPRFAVFWNRELPTRVSDWHGDLRSSVEGSASVSGEFDDKAVDLQGRSRGAAQVERRGGQPADAGSGTMAFDLQAGLATAFAEAGARIIEQSLAMRLTDNALEDGSFSRLSPDQARLQMRALAEHADYVLELRADALGDDPVYRVRILSVKDASVVAAFSSSGRPPESEQAKVWVVGEGGYTRRDRPQTADAVGRELALHAMEQLSR